MCSRKEQSRSIRNDANVNNCHKDRKSGYRRILLNNHQKQTNRTHPTPIKRKQSRLNSDELSSKQEEPEAKRRRTLEKMDNYWEDLESFAKLGRSGIWYPDNRASTSDGQTNQSRGGVRSSEIRDAWKIGESGDGMKYEEHNKSHAHDGMDQTDFRTGGRVGLRKKERVRYDGRRG